MNNFWWLIHIVGISLWFGAVAGGVLLWPSRKSVDKPLPSQIDVATIVTFVTRTGHTGAGLTALGGTVLSFLIQPKSELGTLWLTTMQGLGVIAFTLSVVVLTRVGKRLKKAIHTSATATLNADVSDDRDVKIDTQALSTSASSLTLTGKYLRSYHLWLLVNFILLLTCLIVAAFKPVLHS